MIHIEVGPIEKLIYALSWFTWQDHIMSKQKPQQVSTGLPIFPFSTGLNKKLVCTEIASHDKDNLKKTALPQVGQCKANSAADKSKKQQTNCRSTFMELRTTLSTKCRKISNSRYICHDSIMKTNTYGMGVQSFQRLKIWINNKWNSSYSMKYVLPSAV